MISITAWKHPFKTQIQIQEMEVCPEWNTKSFSKGEKVEFELKPSKDFMTSGMQFVLQFDPNVLQLDKVESAMIDGNQINLLQSEYGKVIVSYDAANGNLIRENESILTLSFMQKVQVVLIKSHYQIKE